MLKLLLLVILALLAVSNAVVDPCAEYQCSTPPPENCPEGCKFDNGCYYSVKQALEGQCVCKEPICHESPAPTSEPHTEPVSEPVVKEPTEPHAEEPTTPHSEPVVGEEPKAEPVSEPVVKEPVSEPVVKEPTEPHAEEPKAPVANECHCEPKEGISHTVKCPGTDYKKYYCMPVHQSKRHDSLVCDWVEKQCPIGVEVVITGDLSNKTAEIISTITEKVNEALGGSTDIEIVVQVKTEEGKTTVTVLVKGTTGQTINVDTKSITDAAVSQLLAEGYNVETTTNIGAPSSASSLQATLFVIVVALLVSLF